jgi:putative SOS response-associated peptidase YedK
MPVMLMTREDVERWLAGTVDEALALQKPANDEAIMVQPPEKKVA